MNDENLVPMNKRTKSAILDMPLKKGKLQQIRNLSEVKGKNITTEQAILLAMVNKALKGNVQAATWVRDTAGCKPVERVEVDEIITAVLTDEIIED